jgi:glycosyltransferase involved in cell wall biosynthesis
VTTRPLRIAMLGSRGVPATYGGVERHVEELGARLVERDHEVYVYSRDHYLSADDDASCRGMHRLTPGGLSGKYLDAISHTAVAAVDALRRPFDVVHYHALGPGLLTPVPRLLSRSHVVLTVHGMDFERDKWGPVARSVLKAAGWVCAHVPDRTVVVAPTLREEFAKRYGTETTYIPNGVEPGALLPPRLIREQFGLAGGDYVLYVGRLVPEKGAHLLLEAWDRLRPAGLKLVIAGGTSFTDDYVARLQSAAAGRDDVLLPGYVYGDALNELYANARVFVQPSSLEGMPLTLLEAAAHGAPVVASDIPVHAGMLGHDAPGQRLFSTGSTESLEQALRRALADPAREREAALRLRERVIDEYSWDRVTEATEELYMSLVSSPAAPGRPRPRARIRVSG